MVGHTGPAPDSLRARVRHPDSPSLHPHTLLAFTLLSIPHYGLSNYSESHYISLHRRQLIRFLSRDTAVFRKALRHLVKRWHLRDR